jgi:hypothetical protein
VPRFDEPTEPMMLGNMRANGARSLGHCVWILPAQEIADHRLAVGFGNVSFGEGRERAKGRGVRFGRPLKLSLHQRREAIERLDAGEAVVDVARTFGVDRALVSPAAWISPKTSGLNFPIMWW